jgi:hypothetical protein
MPAETPLAEQNQRMRAETIKTAVRVYGAFPPLDNLRMVEIVNCRTYHFENLRIAEFRDLRIANQCNRLPEFDNSSIRQFFNSSIGLKNTGFTYPTLGFNSQKKAAPFLGPQFRKRRLAGNQGWQKKVPLLLKERLRSGRESRKKRVEITGFTASLLAFEIALARPKSIRIPEVSATMVSC